MGKKATKTRYTREFKLETVRMFENSKLTVDDLSKKTGISRSLCYRWIAEYRENPENAFPGSGKRKRGTAQEEEIHRLRKQLKEAEEDLEILKNFTPSSRGDRSDRTVPNDPGTRGGRP